MKMILPLLLPLVLFFGGCKKKEAVDGAKSTEETTAPESKSEEAKVNAPTDSLADNIVDKVITVAINERMLPQLMLKKNGVMLVIEQDADLEDQGLTYKIKGNEVLTFKDGERNGGLLFSSSSPKVGDQFEMGSEDDKRKVKIIKIETGKKNDILIENKVHTLSKGTKDLLSSLDTPVVMSFFVSKDKDNMRGELLPFAKRVDLLLKEYERGSSGSFIKIERIDPSPDSDEEDRAKLNNLRGIPGRLGEPAYLGLTITCLDRKSSIPFIDPSRETMLEYDISRAIIEVTRENSPKIGIMSALPVQGGPDSPIPQPDQGQQNRPWAFYTQLKRDYDPDPSKFGSNLIDLGMDIEEIPKDMDVVLLVHPAGISENAQFALDQFLLRGGNIVAFLDSFSAVAAQSQPQRQQFGGAPQAPGIPTSSNLEKLLKAWGVNFESNKVLADRRYETAQSQTSRNPAILSITREAINEDDTLTRKHWEFLMYFSGVFYVSEKEGVKVETLIESSEKSQLVVPQSVQFNPDQVTQNFKASGKKYPLALRLSGKFVTAFPEGTTKDEEFLKKSKEGSSGSVILVADSDMLFDALAVRTDKSGQTLYSNNNLPFLQIAIEVASGGGILYDNEVKPEEPLAKTKSAEPVSVSPNLKYEIKDDTVTITGCDQKATGKLVIPATIEGKTAERIGEKAI